jgi:hypothetical protein
MTTKQQTSDIPFLQLSKSIIDDFSKLKQALIANHSLQSGFIEQFTSLKTNHSHLKKQCFNNFVNSFPKIVKESRKRNKEISCDFNILRMFKINETQHSRLLGEFLNTNGKHGQGDLFLNEFLDLIGIERFLGKERWFVAIERGNIDILLKRVKPSHSVVVIENKSNYAVDQPNQLYRYWMQEIYNTINNKNLPIDYILNPPAELYQIIYLTPKDWKKPNSNTLSRPKDWDKDLPKKVPLTIKNLVFSHFMNEWLSNCLDKLPKDNHRIREYVKQYMEYWT